MLSLRKSPFPITYRELWLPEAINGVGLPSAISGGHALALTGAQKKTTADGVHFDGTATSNINCGAIHNASAKLWVSFRFKIDATFTAGSPASLFLFGKTIVYNTDHLILYLYAVSGKLYFEHYLGGVEQGAIASARTSWVAGVWYKVTASISNANGMRLMIDADAPVTLPADVSAAPNGGDFVFGDRDSPGVGTGMVGVISDVFIGTDDLTPAEETDLYKGIPPADAVEEYLLDEGRGVTATNRGSSGAGANGAISAGCIWAFGQVRQTVLSLDGINDYVSNGANVVDIGGNFTIVTVIKARHTFSSSISVEARLLNARIDANNQTYLFYNVGVTGLSWNHIYSGAGLLLAYTPAIVIGDYLIVIAAVDVSNSIGRLFVNGYLAASGALGPMTGSLANMVLGRAAGGGLYSDQAILYPSLIEGAFTAKQALVYSRWLRDIFNLPINM